MSRTTEFVGKLITQRMGAKPAPAMSPRTQVSAIPNNVPVNCFKDLIEQSRDGIFIGRDNELHRLQQVLERKSKNHPLLIGEPGAGKKSIVGLFAQKIARREVSKKLQDVTILQLDINALLVGSKQKGDVDDRFKKALDSILKLDNDHIVFIDGIENLPTTDFLKSMFDKEIRFIATTTTESFKKMKEKDLHLIDQFTILNIEPASADLAMQILRGIATSFNNHHGVKIGEPAISTAVMLAKRYMQDRCLPDSAIDLLDEACARKSIEIGGMPFAVDSIVSQLQSLKYQISSLKEHSDNVTLKVLAKLEKEYDELEPKVLSMTQGSMETQEAMDTLIEARKSLKKMFLDLESAKSRRDFEQVGVLEHKHIPEMQKRLQHAEEKIKNLNVEEKSNIVTAEDVAIILQDSTGIPVSNMLENESDKLSNMESRMENRVIGQNDAIFALAKSIRRSRAGLRDPGKPIGSFLFMGSSGVGKTEVAKTLAEFLFDDEQAMTRIDMSEFMEKHMAQRLVGAPPGYANSEEGGFLTEAVRRRPYSVLLFDEIEKAHPDVFNLLLQVLDDGRLTDGRGKLADFSNTVIIMTSNIGSRLILDSDPSTFESEEGINKLSETLRAELKNFLRPEFLNRIDDTIIFRPLSKNNLSSIIDIQIKNLEKLVSQHEFKFHLTEAARQELVDISYEPAFGARPLKRSMIKKIQDPMAEVILSGSHQQGETILIDCKDGKFTFGKV